MESGGSLPYLPPYPTLNKMNPAQNLTSHFFKCIMILGLSTYSRHILPSAIFFLDFQTRFTYTFLISAMCKILPTHLNYLKLNLSTGLYPNPVQSSQHRYEILARTVLKSAVQETDCTQ
jgi:hypothetical protein